MEHTEHVDKAMRKYCINYKNRLDKAGKTNPTDDEIWANSTDVVYKYWGKTNEECRPAFLTYYKSVTSATSATS
jgi:hypothetical protein